MKLAEALLERKDKLKKLERLKEEVSSYVITVESEAVPQAWIDDKLEEIRSVSNEIQSLNVAIDKANAEHQSANLNRIRQLDTLIAFYKQLRSTLLNQDYNSSMWGENREKKIKNYNHTDISKKLENLEKERKDLDKTIMKVNWNIEI